MSTTYGRMSASGMACMARCSPAVVSAPPSSVHPVDLHGDAELGDPHVGGVQHEILVRKQREPVRAPAGPQEFWMMNPSRV